MSSRPSRGAARLASILDALPDALLLVNANGTVVNANAIALETFESPGTALVGRGLLDLLPGFDPKRIPGSMRSPQEAAEDTRTKPTRMLARRTDGSEFPVQVTSANLEDGRTPYADYGEPVPHYTGDELLMLVVRDLSGTVDNEAELARQQRQTEMILRAAAEGVVGVDTEGRIVLVNPSAAQILGFRATDLGGKELHALVHHSRPDGQPLPYEETPLADTLRSGRKHRVRGQVLWRKDGKAVPVDLTTAPVRDGEQLVGAVMTFTDRSRYDALAARNEQLRALLDGSLRAPLAELRGGLSGLAADPAGQLWPEANQMLHHLAAGSGRMATLIDNVLSFQRLDEGEEKLQRTVVGMDDLVAAAVEGAVELIGQGRAQFAVHAAPIEASVDAPRLAQALAHLVADVAGVDSAGNAIAFSGDSTIVVAAAQRGESVRLDVRGPSAGGDPVHVPLARGIVELHGGVLQTHEVPGQGSAYVLEVPIGIDPEEAAARAARKKEAEAKAKAKAEAEAEAAAAAAASRTDGGAGESGASGGGARGAGPRGGAHAGGSGAEAASGRPGGPRGSGGQGGGSGSRPVQGEGAGGPGGSGSPWALPPGAADQNDAPTGRRRALRRPEGAEEQGAGADGGQPTGRRARRGRPAAEEESPEDGDRRELPAPPIPNALPPAGGGAHGGRPEGAVPRQGTPEPNVGPGTGRRARRSIEAAPGPAQGPEPRPEGPADGRPQQPAPTSWPQTGPGSAEPRAEGPAAASPQPPAATWPDPERPALPAHPGPTAWPAPGQNGARASDQPPSGPGGAPGQGPAALHGPQNTGGSALPALPEAPSPHHHSRAISVRTLGQGVPFNGDPRQQTQTQAVQAQHPQGLPAQVAAGGSGRRRRLGPAQSQAPASQQAPSSASGAVPSSPSESQALVPNQMAGPGGETQARQHPQADPDSGQLPVRKPGDRDTALLRPVPPLDPRQQPPGRSYAIGAPAAGAAEGPEPLDGPNGAVDVTDVADRNRDRAGDFGDDRHDEPLDEPRRLLVWPEPDSSTRQALTDRGYRPVIVRSREEVDAQVAEPPAALFVDPLTGPITRTALQSLRQAAAAADVPVLVTAGLGQATREAAYGADPAVLLKALAPRDSEQHPPRVLLVEGHEPIATAFAATLERRGMQVTHADSEADAMAKAAQVHPNLVVMDLMLIRRRRQGIVDWLRGHQRLNRTPLVVYTSADIDPAELPRLASGETVLFLAERSTSTDVQSRIVDLLGKIGA